MCGQTNNIISLYIEGRGYRASDNASTTLRSRSTHSALFFKQVELQNHDEPLQLLYPSSYIWGQGFV